MQLIIYKTIKAADFDQYLFKLNEEQQRKK